MLQRTIMIAAALLAAAPARAAVESELIKSGVQAYEDLEYPKAIDLLTRALHETLTREEKIVTYRTLGFAHAALNQMDAARVDFENLLRVSPSLELDRTVAPRVRAVFEKAKAAVATGHTTMGEQALRIPEVEATVDPAAPREGRAITVAVPTAGAAERMALFHRARGQEVFSRVESRADEHGRFAATVPGLEVRAPGLEYYVELLDDGGAVVARSGSFASPLSADVAIYKKPLYKKAWFWGVIGGVVAAGAIAVGVVFATRPTVNASSPSTLTIQPF
jgi:hypothetical protein